MSSAALCANRAQTLPRLLLMYQDAHRSAELRAQEADVLRRTLS